MLPPKQEFPTEWTIYRPVDQRREPEDQRGEAVAEERDASQSEEDRGSLVQHA
jgi:hypothetical protein